MSRPSLSLLFIVLSALAGCGSSPAVTAQRSDTTELHAQTTDRLVLHRRLSEAEVHRARGLLAAVTRDCQAIALARGPRDARRSLVEATKAENAFLRIASRSPRQLRADVRRARERSPRCVATAGLEIVSD